MTTIGTRVNALLMYHTNLSLMAGVRQVKLAQYTVIPLVD